MQPPDAGQSDGPVEAPRESSSRRVPKKRTKTGCLTCRKRRIKCGEEKPICSNCVKSKRICEGYAQRVIFKNPMGIFGTYGPPQSQDFQMHQQMRVPLFNEPLPAQQAAAAAQHPMLAPRPVDMPPNLGYQAMSSSETSPPESKSALPAPQFYYPTPPVNIPPQPWPSHTAEQDQPGFNPPKSTSHLQDQHQSQPQQNSPPVNIGDTDTHAAQGTERVEFKYPQQPVVGWETFPTSQDYAAQYAAQLASESAPNNKSQEHPLFPRQASTYQYPQQFGQMTPGLATSEPFVRQARGQVSYMDEELEDFYDVESDEEMLDQTQSEGFNQLTLIMASANHDSQLRSFRSHLNEPNILANYRPSLGSSPLNNPKTARIFAHFIHSTGPCLSIFERHPTDSSIVLGVQVPPAQQGLWTYTLPLKALEHPALLQAILAVSSLHIASLQGVPSTVSLKHYHYALKRIGRAVSLPMRRKQIGTLAATQLLAYYEVISADHSKWNSHVAGAAQLIKEIDYAGTTRDLRAYRRQIKEQRQQMQWSNPQMYPFGFDNDDEDDPFAEKETSIDEGLLSTILGRAINYDEFGSVEDGQPQSPKKFFSRKDIENFRHQSDLHWWFNKQDVLHSMISGEKLFVPFFMKGQCPPRAGIGRLDAIYGSSDHLWLLLSRITDFGYRDRRRKLRALRMAGTEWRPGPEMLKFMGRFARGNPRKGPGPPGRPPGPPPSSSSTSSHSNPGSGFGSGSNSGTTSVSPPDSAQKGPPSQPPAPEDRPMYGMIPPKPPTRLPSGFVDPRQEQRESSEELDENEASSHREMEDRYKEAEQEWEQILIAVDAFADALGRDFQPLPVDVMPSISTPFGPALQYRTHTIAVIWGFYYAARILLNRFHPSMPPAMMVAAGVAAPTTAEYAQIIGRITAGIYYPQRYNLQAGSLSPTLGSSLTEMTVPVFFAGVQYTDPVQRIWTIAKLRDVARLTGWKTSDAIAGGCEKAWVVAAKLGRGPPYERSFELPADRDAEDVLHRGEAQHSEDRRFVTVELNDRASRGMGLLSLEGDMQNLEV